ncbi:hypothetical protein AVEN_177130-1 [Araneus ventricosus]|uniref:Uncharacterized protein n=1 Tax=Araneus ventricosus TaxID=182803 RepID=A0A4Y2HLN1_ARAVE|nr:hypothetical protein AVEN_177130-1 [Araneus ventricosus]
MGPADRRWSHRLNRCGKARKADNGDQAHPTWCIGWKKIFSATADGESHTLHRIWEYPLVVRSATFTCSVSSKIIWVEDYFPAMTMSRQLFLAGYRTKGRFSILSASNE